MWEGDLLMQHYEQVGQMTDQRRKLAAQNHDSFQSGYQKWYTEALAIVRQLLPDRLIEFQKLYYGDGKHRTIEGQTYNIQDWLNGIRAPEFGDEKTFDALAIVSNRFNMQIQILSSIERRFESTLFDIKQLVQADLFDSELGAAGELRKHGFYGAAGAIAGVVLEKHLGQVVENHKIDVRKGHPTISDLNDALKSAGVLETPTWRGIQRLGDLRNLCDHNKNKEPTDTDVLELIDGVEKITKTLF
jgi:hypothetical protein